MWFGVRRTEAPLTWFQLYDLHSSQLPGFNVPSLKRHNNSQSEPQSYQIFIHKLLRLDQTLPTSQFVDARYDFFRVNILSIAAFGVSGSRNSNIWCLDFQNQQEDCVTRYQTRQDAGGSWPG